MIQDEAVRRFDLLLFDFDGTLCRTREAIRYAIDRTFERFGAPPPPEEDVYARVGEGLQLTETLLRLNPALPGDEIAAWVTAYREIYNGGEGQARTTLFENAVEVLAQLTASGSTIVVVSNKGREAVVTALEHFGLAAHARTAVGHAGKPQPDAFYGAIAEHARGIEPSRTLVIGDTVTDLLFARNIGARSCWAAYGYGATESCSALQPDYTVHGLAELVAVVEGQTE